MLKIITNKESIIVNLYFIGHDFELEVKNVYKIFDFNSDIKIYYENEIDFNKSNFIILSELINSSKGLACKTVLYINKLQFSSITIYEDDIRIEKNDYKKLKKL